MAVRFPRIEWPDPGYANTLDVEYPAHRPVPRSPWVGEVADAPSGYIDTWEEAVHEELELELRRIPPQDKLDATGWHGAAGWNAFRLYAKAGGKFKLYIDRDTPASVHTCQLVEERMEREDDKAQAYRWTIRVRDVTGTQFEV